MSFTLELGRYDVQHETGGPCRGRSILSQYDNETIVVYQTVCEQGNGISNELYTCSNGITDIDKEVVDDACIENNSDQWKEASVCSKLGGSNNEDETDSCKEVKESTQSNVTVEEVDLRPERFDVDTEIEACTNRHYVNIAPDRSNIEWTNQCNGTSSQRDETSKHGIMGKWPHKFVNTFVNLIFVFCG